MPHMLSMPPAASTSCVLMYDDAVIHQACLVFAANMNRNVALKGTTHPTWHKDRFLWIQQGAGLQRLA